MIFNDELLEECSYVWDIYRQTVMDNWCFFLLLIYDNHAVNTMAEPEFQIYERQN